MNKLYDTKEAANYLKVSTGTLENWRTQGEGPKFKKPKGKVYYTQQDLDEWVNK